MKKNKNHISKMAKNLTFVFQQGGMLKFQDGKYEILIADRDMTLPDGTFVKKGQQYKKITQESAETVGAKSGVPAGRSSGKGNPQGCTAEDKKSGIAAGAVRLPASDPRVPSEGMYYISTLNPGCVFPAGERAVINKKKVTYEATPTKKEIVPKEPDLEALSNYMIMLPVNRNQSAGLTNYPYVLRDDGKVRQVPKAGRLKSSSDTLAALKYTMREDEVAGYKSVPKNRVFDLDGRKYLRLTEDEARKLNLNKYYRGENEIKTLDNKKAKGGRLDTIINFMKNPYKR